MTTRYAIINGSGLVINIVMADNTFTPPSGCTLVASAIANVDWTYSNGTFTPPPPPSKTTAQLWTIYQAQAQQAISLTDRVCIRCYKAGVAFPSEWQSYAIALRAILSASSGDPTQPLPTQPSTYPPNT